MKERNTIHAFLLHYGISTVLLCMLVAIVVMLNTVDINQKVTADLLKEKGEYRLTWSKTLIFPWTREAP